MKKIIIGFLLGLFSVILYGLIVYFLVLFWPAFDRLPSFLFGIGIIVVATLVSSFYIGKLGWAIGIFYWVVWNGLTYMILLIFGTKKQGGALYFPELKLFYSNLLCLPVGVIAGLIGEWAKRKIKNKTHGRK